MSYNDLDQLFPNLQQSLVLKTNGKALVIASLVIAGILSVVIGSLPI